ncbi:MAG TPA: hypothetical protein PK569_08015 [Thermoanaerobaculia bacterium]|nr:hypothetical protein [Thermoanaerobaculia bacterium]HQN07503.1 hypothetical protein [Thermoanaerobaculia bacterium]
MADETNDKVHEAFDAVRRDLDERLGVEERAAVERLRDAAVDGDAARAREELAAVRERHGWLYEELVKHPSLAAVIDELALWGF